MERSSHLASLFRLDGRTAVVTGAASGLGRAIALGLLDAGADVVAVDRDLAGISEAVEQCERLTAVEADVTDRAAVAAALEAPTRLDVLVNSAGIGGWGSTTDYPADQWQQVLDINLTGTFNCCRSAGRRMIEAGSGSIVNVASTLGLVGSTGTIAYAASKGGVVQVTRALAVEWAQHGVRVNAVAPSTFETELVRRNRPLRPDVYERLLDLTPAGRFGDPAEIVGPVLFLAADAASMVTGQILAVDGGYTAQ